MSISQHIAGIRLRTGTQSRSDVDDINSNDNEDDDLGQARRDSQADLSQSLESAKIISDTKVLNALQKPSFVSLDQIDNVRDFGEKLQQMKTLERLEQQWFILNGNLVSTLDHLRDSSFQVTQSSKECMNTYRDSVETSCDKIDEELKAFFLIMTKCDELTTKLSIASSFRDEVKTLRKSVETLEQLYK